MSVVESSDRPPTATSGNVSWVCMLDLALVWLTTGLALLSYRIAKYRLDQGLELGLSGVLASLTITDLLSFAITGLVGIALLYRLVAAQPPWLARMDHSTPYTVAVLLPLALLLSHALLAIGYPVTGDAGAHLVRSAHFADALRAGDSLFWDNAFFAGSSLLQFTGPLFHWTTGLVDLATDDSALATKIVVTACRLGTGLLVFGYLRLIGVDRVCSAAGALFVVGSFVLSYAFSIRSIFPQSLVILCFSGLLLLIECQLRAPRVQWWCIAGMALVSMIFIGTHQPTAVYGAIVLGLYTVVRLPSTVAPWMAIRGFALAVPPIAIGVLYFVIPFVMEQGATAAPARTEGFLSLGPPAAERLIAFITFGGYTGGDEYAAYLGLTLLAIAAAGVLAVLKPERRPLFGFWLALAVALAVTLVLRGRFVRDALFVAILLGPLAAIGLQALRDRLPSRAFLAILLLPLLELGALSVQPWVRSDFGYLVARGEELHQMAGKQRVAFLIGQEVNFGPGSGLAELAFVQALHGPHKEDATPAHNAIMTALSVLQEDLVDDPNGELSATTETVLELLNTALIVSTDRDGIDVPAAVASPTLGRHIVVPEPTPVLWAPSLTAAEATPDWQRPYPIWYDRGGAAALAQARADLLDALARMAPDTSKRTAVTFLLASAGIEQDNAPVAVSSATLAVERYEVERAAVQLDLMVSEPGYVRLAHPYSAFAKVQINDVLVDAVPDITGMMIVPVMAGSSEILVRWEPSPLRQSLFAVSLATMTLVAVMLLVTSLAQAWTARKAA